MSDTLFSHALTTPQRVANFMDVTYASLTTNQQLVLLRLCNAVTSYIENLTSRRYKLTTYTNEQYDSDGGDSLSLKQFPVTAVSSVQASSGTNSWDSVNSDNYDTDLNAGIIRGLGGFKFGRARAGFRVTYSAGYDFDNSATFLGDTAA